MHGVLPAVLAAARSGATHVVVPVENVGEAQLVDGVTVHGAGCLRDVVDWYAAAEHGTPLPPAPPPVVGASRPGPGPTSPTSSASRRRGSPSSWPPRAGTTC